MRALKWMKEKGAPHYRGTDSRHRISQFLGAIHASPKASRENHQIPTLKVSCLSLLERTLHGHDSLTFLALTSHFVSQSGHCIPAGTENNLEDEHPWNISHNLT